METTNLIYLSFLSECTQNALKYQGEDNFRRGQPILIWSFLFRLSQTRAHIFYKVTTVSLWSSVPHPSSPKQSKIPRTVEEHNFLRRKKRGWWWLINHVHKFFYPSSTNFFFKNWDSLEVIIHLLLGHWCRNIWLFAATDFKYSSENSKLWFRDIAHTESTHQASQSQYLLGYTPKYSSKFTLVA